MLQSLSRSLRLLILSRAYRWTWMGGSSPRAPGFHRVRPARPWVPRASSTAWPRPPADGLGCAALIRIFASKWARRLACRVSLSAVLSLDIVELIGILDIALPRDTVLGASRVILPMEFRVLDIPC